MKIRINILFGVFLVTAGSCQADVLKLKQGGGVQGILVSANSQEIVFMSVSGTLSTYPVSVVAGLDFAPLPPPPKPAKTVSTAEPRTAPAPSADGRGTPTARPARCGGRWTSTTPELVEEIEAEARFPLGSFPPSLAFVSADPAMPP